MSKISANEFDEKFDNDEDITQYLNLDSVTKVKELNIVKNVRNKLKLSQAQFSARFNLNLRSLQDWEQGKRALTPAAKNFFMVINYFPEVVDEALKKGSKNKLT